MNEKKNRFRTQYDRERIRSVPGSRERILYEAQFDDKGNYDLVESGKENLYDYIQSFAASVDINVIMKKFANGDTSALARRQGTYGDFTDMPKNYAEMLDRLNKAENYFNGLPVDVRAKFNHNFGEFVAQLGSDDAYAKLGLVPDPAPEPVKEEPIE